VSRSPYFLGPYYASFKDRPVCKDFVTILRTGRPASWAAHGGRDWLGAMLDPAFARQFTAAMDCRGVYLGQVAARAVDLARHHGLLDIAGGSGVYACAFADRHPHLRATVLERPPVDEVARRAIAERGFSARVGVAAGDMIAGPLPGGFDVHLLSNVLHDFDLPTVDVILRHSFDALEPGGLVVVHDAHLDDDKAGPLAVAAYSVLLMHACEGRCYSRREMFGRLEAAGFRDPGSVATAAGRSLITAVRP
jgi:SAM-dependent methyltransferase